MWFSKEWNQRYKEDTQMSIWPGSDLIDYVIKYVPFVGSSTSVSEVDCGAWGSTQFYKSLGLDFLAIKDTEP